MSVTHSAQIWSLSDDRAGNRRQADALAMALDPDARHVALATHAPWRWLAPRLLPRQSHAFGTDFTLAAPLPRVAVGCGRQAALATRWLKSRGTFAVQILDPRLDPASWDLVVAPEHDGLAGANVITLLGSLHPVDDAWLAQARDAYPQFANLPRPRTTVLIGGSSAHALFGAAAFEALSAQLQAALSREGGSVLLTTSRRTPREVRAALERRDEGIPGIVWRSDDDGPNPYAGLLGWADRIVCSPDSVNMLSEACATRVPVFVFDPDSVSGRPRRFLDALLARGRIRAMDDTLAPFEAEPLRETARVAAEVRARLPR